MWENGGVLDLEVSPRSKTAVKRMKAGKTWKNWKPGLVRKQDTGVNICEM